MLIALAGALTLPMEGTVVELVKNHLADNPGRANGCSLTDFLVVREDALPLGPVPPSHQLSHHRWCCQCHSLSPQQICSGLQVKAPHVALDFPSSSSRSIPHTHNAPLIPHLPYHTYSHVNYHGDGSYNSYMPSLLKQLDGLRYYPRPVFESSAVTTVGVTYTVHNRYSLITHSISNLLLWVTI